jgi:hypothetical protein
MPGVQESVDGEAARLARGGFRNCSRRWFWPHDIALPCRDIPHNPSQHRSGTLVPNHRRAANGEIDLRVARVLDHSHDSRSSRDEALALAGGILNRGVIHDDTSAKLRQHQESGIY